MLQGDDGGPLVIASPQEYAGMYDLIGVANFGWECGNGWPSIYGRVYYDLPWLERTIWPEEH